MDPDSEAEQAASQILRTTLITVVFTACHTYRTETSASVNHIQYSLPDSTAKVVQKAMPQKKKKKTIYLTFDDGPNKGTKKLFDIINEEQVPVTVFIIGEHVYGSREQTAIFDSLVNDKYFEIANHSYTHAFHNKFAKFYAVPDSVVKDFVRCSDSLHLTANIIRTPGRNIWRTENINSTDIKTCVSTADSLKQHSFTIVGWDLEWHFNDHLGLTNTSDEMIKKVDSMFVKGKTKTQDNLVLLAHDQVYEDAADSSQLHDFIKKLKASNEYDFEVVSNYPALKP
jgi:peptidoglycan-N-acetylglucosamine deacetylase